MDIKVTIKKVCFTKENSDSSFWLILDTSEGTCKGAMAWTPTINEKLVLTGKHTTWQGKREFKFTTAMPDVPSDSRSRLEYVCSITKGIGETMQEKIWAEKAEDWEEIEDSDVKKLTGELFKRFQASLSSVILNERQVNTIAFLKSKGCTFKMANAAWELWEKDTIGIVSADPYKLSELPNYGFASVDNSIRQNFEILDNDHRRIKASITHAMKHLTQDGSTVVEWPKLYNQAITLTSGLYGDIILNVTAEMIRLGTLRGWPDKQLLALSSTYKHEATIWEYSQANQQGK